VHVVLRIVVVCYTQNAMRMQTLLTMSDGGNLYNRTRLTPFVKQLMARWFAWQRRR
jgi:hypothetical protein